MFAYEQTFSIAERFSVEQKERCVAAERVAAVRFRTRTRAEATFVRLTATSPMIKLDDLRRSSTPT